MAVGRGEKKSKHLGVVVLVPVDELPEEVAEEAEGEEDPVTDEGGESGQVGEPHRPADLRRHRDGRNGRQRREEEPRHGLVNGWMDRRRKLWAAAASAATATSGQGRQLVGDEGAHGIKRL